MDKYKVRTPAQALAYITDCNLATVCDLASKKSKSKHEYSRQISIAQQAIDWMVAMDIDFSGTRAVDVQKFGSVEAWASQWH